MHDIDAIMLHKVDRIILLKRSEHGTILQCSIRFQRASSEPDFEGAYHDRSFPSPSKPAPISASCIVEVLTGTVDRSKRPSGLIATFAVCRLMHPAASAPRARYRAGPRAPAANRSSPAQAIIAALSVQSRAAECGSRNPWLPARAVQRRADGAIGGNAARHHQGRRWRIRKILPEQRHRTARCGRTEYRSPPPGTRRRHHRHSLRLSCTNWRTAVFNPEKEKSAPLPDGRPSNGRGRA